MTEVSRIDVAKASSWPDQKVGLTQTYASFAPASVADKDDRE